MQHIDRDGHAVISQDPETGESVVRIIDQETGELRATRMIPPPRRPPATYLAPTRPPAQIPPHAYGGASPRLLLILTTMICPSVVVVLLFLLEVYLHVRCHRQNHASKHEDVYYRSPFHVLTSRFCGACRESELAMRVGQLQDKRRDRYHYLKGIVS